jgi:ferredoxin
MIKRLRVDPIACAAHGMCADLLPDHIDLDEWGYPILADGRTGRLLGRDDQRDARAAVEACPTLALRIEATPR